MCKIRNNQTHNFSFFRVCIICFCSNLVCAQQIPDQLGLTPEPLVIQPEPAIQEILHSMINCMESDEKDKELMLQLTELLQTLAGKEFEVLIPQLVYFRENPTQTDRPSMYEAMIFEAMVERFRIENRQIASALVPYLEVSDSSMRETVREFLHLSEYNPVTNGRRNFSHYKGLISKTEDGVVSRNRELIVYLFRTDPGEALIMFAIGSHRKQARSLRWAEHQVSDTIWKWTYSFLPKDAVEPVAAEALRELVDHPEWMARLYVAEIMLKYPPFRDDVIIEQLAEDIDESVKGVAQEILVNMALCANNSETLSRTVSFLSLTYFRYQIHVSVGLQARFATRNLLCAQQIRLTLGLRELLRSKIGQAAGWYERRMLPKRSLHST